MKQSLITINEILSSLNIAPISEHTAKQYEIVGGESYAELNEMANCYAGEVEAVRVQKSFYANTVQF